MDICKITFNDGSVHEYPKGTCFYDVSKDFEMDNIVGFKINNEVFPLDKLVSKSETIEFVNTNDIIGNKIYKAGLKFLFQVALEECFPGLEVSYNHSVPKGMLGSITGDKILTHDDVLKIKKCMIDICEANEKITRLNISPKEAIKFYFNKNENEKAINIHNISDKVVNLYKLRGKFNYFYSIMPYSTSVINKFELVYLGKNDIVFLFPTVNSKGEVPDYVHYDNIITSFMEGKKWLSNMHMPYVTDLNETIGTGAIRRFIRSCELHFNDEIRQVIDQFKDKRDIKILLIAGPSSSGKTTTTNRLAAHLEALGYSPISISLDDYFVNREDTPKDEFGEYDFECVKALDIDYFNEQLQMLLDGKEVKLPRYNFLTGKREVQKSVIKLQDNSIILIEGLHALNDELTKKIDKRFKFKIYLSPFIPLNIDKHNYISTLDLRLLRRIVRDNRTRGYDVISTIDKWQSVRRGEEKYIFPYIHQADIILNTALAYEIGVIKVYVEPLLLSVSVDSKYYEEARRLVDFLKQFFPIPGEYVNDESILREFIGGKFND